MPKFPLVILPSPNSDSEFGKDDDGRADFVRNEQKVVRRRRTAADSAAATLSDGRFSEFIAAALRWLPDG